MENAALILGSLTFSRSGVVLCLAALSGGCAFLGLQRNRRKDLFPAMAVLLFGVLLSLPLSRLIHWYSNTSQYPSFFAALTDYSTGGFVVLGVYAAFLLSALLMYALGAVRKLPTLLDDLSCAGMLAASLGKLACLFSPVCRSKFTLEGEFFRRLPFMVSSTLSNGTVEWRIATFCLQSIAYFLIFLAAALLFRGRRGGESFALTLSLAGAVHVVLDSTRYDAAYLRSNGFVSITQIFCLAALLAVAVVFSVRSVKRSGLCGRHFLYWLLWAAFAGVGGYCEYYVQRHGASFLRTYTLMELCFLALFVLNLLLCDFRPKKKTASPAEEPEKRQDETEAESAEAPVSPSGEAE